jgi:cobyrinic acid a,c-diamide synthase
MDQSVTRTLPRLVLAGLAGDSGKTLVSVGLALVLRDRGIPVCGFKKGPDYIDTAWLRWATGQPARNLDTYLMGADVARGSFVEHAIGDGVNIIEGNRGVYDGSDARGTHSTAQLAKLLRAPVVLVVDAAKVTRTAAACVLGCQAFDPDVRFAGVVLNRVAGARHERVLREAIESTCKLPVLGAVARADARRLLPGRHLGLVTPEEHSETDDLGRELREVVKALDVDRLLALARQAPALDARLPGRESGPAAPPVTVGFLLDSAFTFYYAENLEALESAGARLVPISALTAAELPADLDALYIGGGFPETHATALASNARFLGSVKQAAEGGLPIYAECGGLMLLSEAIWWQRRKYPMAGVLPFDVEVQATPQGHGYTQLVVDRPNPFFAEGTALKGHEFHYSRVLAAPGSIPTACAVLRGAGCGAGRDAIVVNQAFACYTHLHALATPQWATGLIAAARRFNAARQPSRNPGTAS